MNLRSQIQLLLLIQFIIITCLDMTDPYWPLIIRHLFKSTDPNNVQFWAAAIYIIPTVIAIGASPLWCNFGDKFGHKKMLVRASSALMVTQLLIGFSTQLWVILIIKVLQGIFAGFTVAAQAWIISISLDKNQSKLIADAQSAIAAGTIVGPILGGIIATYINYQAIFISSAVIILAATIVVAYGLQETSKQVTSDKTRPVAIKANLLRYAAIWLILICLIQIARSMSNNFFPLYITLYLHQSSLMVGVFYSVTATMLIGSTKFCGAILFKLENEKHIYKIFIAAAFSAAASQGMYAFADNTFWVLCASLWWGISLGILSLISFSLLLKELSQFKIQLLGLGNSMIKLGNLLGVGIGSILYVHLNFFYSFIIIALLYLFIGGYIILLYFSRNLIIFRAAQVD